MDGWTKLYERSTESVSLAELFDEEPEAFALFVFMLAKAGVWGRFPGNTKLLKSRVAPLSDRLTSTRISELLPLLEEREMITRYTVDGVEFLYNTNHFAYNGNQAWHRVGKPEFPVPPGFCLPKLLQAYLVDVHAGKYSKKTVAGECKKMGLDYDQSTGVVHGSSLGLVQGPVTVNATLQTLDVRRETSDVRKEGETYENLPASSSKDLKGMKRPNGAKLLIEYCLLAAAVRDVYGEHWAQAKQNDFVADAGSALSEPGCTVSEDEAISGLHGDGKPQPDQRGDWWVGDLCKQQQKQQVSNGGGSEESEYERERNRLQAEARRLYREGDLEGGDRLTKESNTL